MSDALTQAAKDALSAEETEIFFYYLLLAYFAQPDKGQPHSETLIGTIKGRLDVRRSWYQPEAEKILEKIEQETQQTIEEYRNLPEDRKPAFWAPVIQYYDSQHSVSIEYEIIDAIFKIPCLNILLLLGFGTVRSKHDYIKESGLNPFRFNDRNRSLQIASWKRAAAGTLPLPMNRPDGKLHRQFFMAQQTDGKFLIVPFD